LTTGASSHNPFEQEQGQARQEQEEEQEQEPKIYDVADGSRSKDTTTTYRIAFKHFLEVTIKSKNLRALLDTK
jgi:hypothetical protein